MKRYDVDWFGSDLEENPDGFLVRHDDIAPLIAAVDKLLAAKGRYHTEQNYKALVEARAALEKAQ